MRNPTVSPDSWLPVMDELSVHWMPLLHSGTRSRTGRPTRPIGADRRRHTLPTVFDSIPPNPPRRPRCAW